MDGYVAWIDAARAGLEATRVWAGAGRVDASRRRVLAWVAALALGLSGSALADGAATEVPEPLCVVPRAALADGARRDAVVAAVSGAGRLGCGAVWLPPLFEAADPDGLLPLDDAPIAPALEAGTRAVVTAARHAGLPVVGSLVARVVDAGHPWARAARQGDVLLAAAFVGVPVDAEPEARAAALAGTPRGARAALTLDAAHPTIQGRLARMASVLAEAGVAPTLVLDGPAGRARGPDEARLVDGPWLVAGDGRGPRALDAPLMGGFGAREVGRHFVRGGRAVALLLDPEPDDPLGLAALLRAVARDPAAWLGRRVPLEVPRRGDGEAWAATIEDGAARLLAVWVEGATLELPPKLLDGAEPVFRGRGVTVDDTHRVSGVGLYVARLRPAARGDMTQVVRFVGTGEPARAVTQVDLGRPFDAARGHGADRASAEVRAGRGLVLGGAGRPQRFAWVLEPGAYTVEVRLREPLPRDDPGLVIEGRAPTLARDRRSMRLGVLVRDGRLSVWPRSRGSAAAILEVEARREKAAKGAPAAPIARADGRRVIIEAPSAGVVEWRLDDAQAEPVDETPLERAGKVYRATLGPFPAVVRRVSWVVRVGERFSGVEAAIALPP
jgi:hypothetical protein